MAGFRKTPIATQEEKDRAKEAVQTALPSSLPSSAQVPIGTEPEDDGEEENPIQVTEAVEVDSLADQESNVLPAASRVLFIVKKAELRIEMIDNKLNEGDRLDAFSMDVNKITAYKLHLELKVNPQGIDDTGKLRNRVTWADFYVALHKRNNENDMQALRESHARKSEQKRMRGQVTKPFNKEWWLNESRYTAKQFYGALGFDVAKPPICNDDFLISLQGVEIVADIFRVPDDFRGGFKNEVKNFRSVQE